MTDIGLSLEQRKLLDLIAAELALAHPVYVVAGQRAGKTMVAERVAMTVHNGATAYVNLTQEIANDQGVNFTHKYGIASVVKRLMHSEIDRDLYADIRDALLVFDEAGWYPPSVNMVEVVEAARRYTPYVLVITSEGPNTSLDGLWTAGYATWDLNPNISYKELVKYFIEDPIRAARDFGLSYSPLADEALAYYEGIINAQPDLLHVKHKPEYVHKGLPVAGYKNTQSEANIQMANEGKYIEETFLRWLDRLAADPNTDKRLVALAKTNVQDATMWGVRSIFQPNRLDLPGDVEPYEAPAPYNDRQ